jgi:hypothetical protein
VKWLRSVGDENMEAARRIVSAKVARGARLQEPGFRPTHVPEEPGSEFMLV